jgi:hypothetical protein
MLINAGPGGFVGLHSIVSACQSAKSGLIFWRSLCGPPAATPPGVLVSATTVTPGGEKFAVPWKVTVAPVASAGANTIKVTGLVTLSEEIGAGGVPE